MKQHYHKSVKTRRFELIPSENDFQTPINFLRSVTLFGGTKNKITTEKNYTNRKLITLEEFISKMPKNEQQKIIVSQGYLPDIPRVVVQCFYHLSDYLELNSFVLEADYSKRVGIYNRVKKHYGKHIEEFEQIGFRNDW